MYRTKSVLENTAEPIFSKIEYLQSYAVTECLHREYRRWIDSAQQWKKINYVRIVFYKPLNNINHPKVVCTAYLRLDRQTTQYVRFIDRRIQ